MPTATTPAYNDTLTAADQVDAEEAIASLVFQHEATATDTGEPRPLDEEDCADLGRRTLLLVLARFRPDLMAART